ncbi:MAG: thiamine-phosphate kinase [Proteobacteria bacterium]|nr:thiamine-phosphate kinase [Pseudomonadota bacterium]
MANEFDLIRRYFTRPARSAVLGVGDDCALLPPRPGMLLAVSTDMLVEGRHFMPGADPEKLGAKSLAVNLSDLAAMGADPRWATLALALPDADEVWVAAFARGFFGMAERFGVELIGGDTTRGPRCISITIMGELPPGLALRRDGAHAGDDIWISESTGDAALGLAHLAGTSSLTGDQLDSCLGRLHTPEPRVELGGRLRGIARSAIDISDGLLADIGHILEESGVAAEVRFDALPRSAAMSMCSDAALAADCLLAGGDDYELAFTAQPFHRNEIESIGHDLDLRLTRIGVVVAASAADAGRLTLRDGGGNPISVARKGFDHFA